MLTRILTDIVTYGLLALVVFWLTRMSIRHEMSTHASPPYRVALPFLKMVSTLAVSCSKLLLFVSRDAHEWTGAKREERV